MDKSTNFGSKIIKNQWFWVPVCLFFGIGTYLINTSDHGDEIIALNQWRVSPYNLVFRIWTLLGEYYPHLIAFIITWFISRNKAWLVGAVGLVILPLSYSLKKYSLHERPLTYLTHQGRFDKVVVVPEVKLNSGHTSFPSGHTMSAFGLYSILAFLLPSRHRYWGFVFAILAIGVGFSRIFLVQHFLADVLAGACCGLIVAVLVYTIYRNTVKV